ncbi:MAG: hypothetical protein ACE5K4_06165 [Candidatus Hydrothermarchaeota archaeon]
MKLDMSKYRPFKEMGKTCKTRKIRDKRVIWPDFSSKPFFKGKYRVRMIGRDDVEEVAELWRQSYPEIYGSPYEFILFPEEYEEKVALKETWERDRINKKHCMPVVEEIETRKLVTVAMLTKEDKNLEIEYSMLGTHPDYREKRITYGLGWAIREKIEESGAEYITAFLETWHDITQMMALRGGMKIAGIFPGRFTRWQGNQREYRGCVVYVYSFIGQGEDYSTKPDEWVLYPEVRELWEEIEKINQKIQEKIEKIDPERIREYLLG